MRHMGCNKGGSGRPALVSRRRILKRPLFGEERPSGLRFWHSPCPDSVDPAQMSVAVNRMPLVEAATRTGRTNEARWRMVISIVRQELRCGMLRSADGHLGCRGIFRKRKNVDWCCIICNQYINILILHNLSGLLEGVSHAIIMLRREIWCIAAESEPPHRCDSRAHA